MRRAVRLSIAATRSSSAGPSHPDPRWRRSLLDQSRPHHILGKAGAESRHRSGRASWLALVTGDMQKNAAPGDASSLVVCSHLWHSSGCCEDWLSATNLILPGRYEQRMAPSARN